MTNAQMSNSSKCELPIRPLSFWSVPIKLNSNSTFCYSLCLRFSGTLTFFGFTCTYTLSIFSRASSLTAKFCPCLEALFHISASLSRPLGNSLLLTKLFFCHFLLCFTWMVSTFRVLNITESEHLPALLRCMLFFPILLIPETFLPLLKVMLSHCALSSYDQTFCLPTSFSISGFARHRVNLDSLGLLGESLHAFTCSYFSLRFPGRLFALAFRVELTLSELSF